MKKKDYRKLFWFVVFMLALTAPAWAQTNGPTGPIDDNAAIAFFAKLNKWQLFLIPVTMAVVELLKRGITAIPASWLPWIAPFIGAILQYLGSKVGLWTADASVGAAFGALATWFNEAGASKALDTVLPGKSSPPS